MQSLTWVVIVLAMVAVAYLLRRLQIQGRLLTSLQQEQAELAAAWHNHPVSPSHIDSPNARPVIAIEILNPVQLAVAESPFAGAVNNFAPATIRRIVYRRTVEIMREELKQKGVEAEMRIHGLT